MPAYDGQDIITNVTFISSPSDATYKFERIFHYPNRTPHYFISIDRYNTINAEVMSFGLTWHAYYALMELFRLKHKGYSLHLFSKCIPIPPWLIGSGNAKEWALDDDPLQCKWTSLTLFLDSFMNIQDHSSYKRDQNMKRVLVIGGYGHFGVLQELSKNPIFI